MIYIASSIIRILFIITGLIWNNIYDEKVKILKNTGNKIY